MPIVFLLVGAGIMYWLLGHHIVITDSDRVIVPKASMGLSDSYVDIVDWTAEDFKEHPELTKALVDNGHGDLIVETAGQKILDAVKSKADEWFKGDK